MVVILLILIALYIGYLVLCSENMEIMVFARTSGKRIGIGVVQEKRVTGMYEIVDIEISFIVLFFTMRFTRFK